MKEQMEEEKAVIDRERAIAEGRDGEAKEEEVDHPLLPVEACPNTAPYAWILPHGIQPWKSWHCMPDGRQC